MADLRSLIEARLDSFEAEHVNQLVDTLLDAKKLKTAFYQPDPCKKCGERAYPKKVQVEYPDIDKVAKVLAILLDQSKGKPAETRKVEVSSRPLEQLSDAELAALASGS